MLLISNFGFGREVTEITKIIPNSVSIALLAISKQFLRMLHRMNMITHFIEVSKIQSKIHRWCCHYGNYISTISVDDMNIALEMIRIPHQLFWASCCSCLAFMIKSKEGPSWIQVWWHHDAENVFAISTLGSYMSVHPCIAWKPSVCLGFQQTRPIIFIPMMHDQLFTNEWFWLLLSNWQGKGLPRHTIPWSISRSESPYSTMHPK